MAKKSDSTSNRTSKSNHQKVRDRKGVSEKSIRVSEVLYKTLWKFFPKFTNWLDKIREPRNVNMTTYELRNLAWIGILLFICKLTSRRQIKFEFITSEFLKNLNIMAKTDAEQLADPDTLAYLLERLNPKELSKLRKKMIYVLLRKRCLEKFRLLDKYYLIVIDGTGHLVFKKRHCKHCLRRKLKDGTTIYYHHILEAKLVCSNGLAFSIATEFIENIGPKETKQDCELKAFYRLAPKLKNDFPQLNICLSLDSLYMKVPVFDICEKNGWKYITTFKKGSMPEVYQVFESLKKSEGSSSKYEDGEIKQKYYWVEDVLYYKPETSNVVNVLECIESKPQKKDKKFVWATNLNIDKTNFHEIGLGGRFRWKIENEGFNMQKNGGYNLEHVYSEDIIAIKNFYLLMQIAHILLQLIEKGSLLIKGVKKMFGSIKNFARRLLENLRREVLSLEELQNELSKPFQIRLYDRPP